MAWFCCWLFAYMFKVLRDIKMVLLLLLMLLLLLLLLLLTHVVSPVFCYMTIANAEDIYRGAPRRHLGAMLGLILEQFDGPWGPSWSHCGAISARAADLGGHFGVSWGHLVEGAGPCMANGPLCSQDRSAL